MRYILMDRREEGREEGREGGIGDLPSQVDDSLFSSVLLQPGIF